MIAWIAVPVVLLGLGLYYIYRIILRGVDFFAKKISNKKQKILSAVLTLSLCIVLFIAKGIGLVFLIYFLMTMVLVDIIRMVICKLLRKEAPYILNVLYKSGILAIVPAVVIVVAGMWNMHNIVATRYNVNTDKEMQSKGYNIVLISDLHFGTTMNENELSVQMKKVEKEKPDIMILAGDIVDESTTLEEMKEAFSVLGSVKTKYGVYFVYGNHDLSSYSSKPNYTGEELCDALADAGITTLKDSSDLINDELYVIGRNDRGSGIEKRKSVNELVADLNDNMYKIVIDHQPYEYDKAVSAGVDMILSGHTHAGQIFPGDALIRLFNSADLDYGYKQIGNMSAIVSSGIAGWSFPVRTEKHSEYVVIHLQSDK